MSPEGSVMSMLDVWEKFGVITDCENNADSGFASGKQSLKVLSLNKRVMSHRPRGNTKLPND